MIKTVALLGALALAAFSAACLGPGSFVCHDDQACGADAFCEATGHCSRFDTACPSGRRYLHATGGDADACVAPTCADDPIVTLTAGGAYACLLRRAGAVTCWGRNDDGELGDGTSTPRAAGVQVLGLDDARALATGERHACAVRAGGTVVCWGADDTGQLGDGGGLDQRTPIAVPGVIGATALAAGAGFTCALLADRSAVCWGDDRDGELGDGAAATTPRPPTPVLGLTGARALSAHWQHACAVLAGGAVACWGNNASGQLGDGTLTNRAQPVMVPGLANVVAVATGLSHTCAMNAGGVRCWGDDSQGQLGSGAASTAPVTQPTLVPIVLDPIAIAAGAQHTCAVRLDGQVLCWGQNGSGQLGEGSMSSLAEPVPVTGLTNGVTAAAGATFSCATTRDGAVFCWGDDRGGQLGTGRAVVRAQAAPVALDAVAVTAGGAHTCAVSRGGATDAVVCWGADQAGQLGDNDNVDRARPAPIEVPLAPAMLTAGALHTCAIDTGAALWCWGRGSSGQLGPGHAIDTPFPIQVAMPTGAERAASVTAGDAHTCALVAPGDGLGDEIYCFGDNSYGQLGDGTQTSRATPAPAPLGTTAVRAAQVSAGSDHTCAVDVTGRAWCWGRGGRGQLGDGTATDQPAPVPVSLPDDRPVAAIAGGGAHTCALDQTGGVWCWGADDRGQLGLGTAGADLATPSAAVALPARAANVATGGAHTCATLADGSVWCWGANDSGQLGDGSTTDRATPARVPGAVGTVSAGALHTCAASKEGAVTCWGADTSGQLGDAAALTVSAPVLARVACP